MNIAEAALKVRKALTYNPDAETIKCHKGTAPSVRRMIITAGDVNGKKLKINGRAA